MALTLAMPGMIACGRRFSLNLEWLAAHNVLEHDASLVHADAPKGAAWAPIHVDPAVLKDLLTYSSDGKTMALKDWAHVRADRERKLETPLTSFQLTVSHGELALATLIMNNELAPPAEGGGWPLSVVRQWFGEERLPDGWRKVDTPVGLSEVNALSKELTALINERNGVSVVFCPPSSPGRDCSMMSWFPERRQVMVPVVPAYCMRQFLLPAVSGFCVVLSVLCGKHCTVTPPIEHPTGSEVNNRCIRSNRIATSYFVHVRYFFDRVGVQGRRNNRMFTCCRPSNISMQRTALTSFLCFSIASISAMSTRVPGRYSDAATRLFCCLTTSG